MTRVNICLACLTERQKQVYRLYKKGLTMRLVGKKLGICESVVSRTLKICVDKLYKFHYNLGRYREIAKSAKLTPRERDVFRRWKIYGHDNEKIGKAVGLSASTIKKYKWKIGRKVNVDELKHATVANDTFNESDSFESFDYKLDPI